MGISTSWLIGSVYIPTTGVTLNGSAYNIDAGYYYLRHTTAAISLIDVLDNLLAIEGIGGHIVYVAKDRKVRIGCNPGDEFTLVWPDSLRVLFGFDANLPASTNFHEADSVSPLLWSAGKPHTPNESPFNSKGRRVYDTRIGTAPDGTQVADSHHTQIINNFSWSHVAYTRFQTDSDLNGGEYVAFFDYVLRNGYKFWLYAFVDESLEADTNAVTWPTNNDKLGPYGYRTARTPAYDFQRSSGHQFTGRFNQVSLDCIITPEWE